jgi:hypothetical protein
MNAKIFSNECGHFLESTLSFVILGEDNGNAVQCHPKDVYNGNTRGVGRIGVKQGGCTLSKFRLSIPNGKKKGALG